MIKNVNLMQNPEDIAFDKYSEEYLIQALANLGQRIGIKGDGISYKSFKFNDLLLNESNKNPDEYIGYIEYIQNDNGLNALFGLANKNNLEDSKTFSSTINTNNTLNFGSELTLSVPVSGIEKYSANSICINENNELTFILVGKRYGYKDTDENNAVLMYYKFNILTNKLIYGYKLAYYTTDEKQDNYYYLINIKEKENNNYSFTVNIFNSSFLILDDDETGTYKTNFEKLFTYSNYAYTTLMFSILNNEYKDIDKLLHFDSERIDFNSAISLVLNLPQSAQYSSMSISLKLDTYKNELLSIDDANNDISNKIDELNDLLRGEYDLNVDINEEIFNINEDINKLYINIFEYYNNRFYLQSREELIKRILLKLYERAAKELKSPLGKRLYIPLDYEFHYICNSNDELNVYYSTNIYVTYTSLSKYVLSEFWNSNKNLVFDYENLNKLKVYNFEINYNSFVDTLINSIDIKDIYTMPYINAYNNWSINDTDTKIKAIGKDAGNPNIIIIYNNDKNNTDDSYSVLNIVSNKEKINKANYRLTWFNVNCALFENINNIDVKCCAYIPEITDENYEYFKDSIILSISDLNCLRDEEFKYKCKGSYIISLWGITDTDNILKYECIKQTDTDYALALGYSVNMLNEMSDESIANLNSQDLILLKAIINNVAQERLNIDANNWLVIKNKQAEEYNVENNAYKNDLNMIMQYDDDISIVSNHVVHGHSDYRYISDIGNVSLTNSLYPKYNRTTEEIKINKETIAINTKKLLPEALRSSIIEVNGNKITNIESLIEKLKETYVTTLEEVEIDPTIVVKRSLNKTASNYYEYVFNDNVPSLDFKEIFNRNVNVLNRVNIISPDTNGTLYNAYIGTSYDESDKSTLHIGSNNLNINVGSDTLMKEDDKDQFGIHKKLSLDFDTIKLNAKNTIELSCNPIQTHAFNNLNINIASIDLIDKVGMEIVHNENTNLDEVNVTEKTLFAKFGDNYYICLNYLMEKLNIDILTYSEVKCGSPDNTYITAYYEPNKSKSINSINSNSEEKLIPLYFIAIENKFIKNDKILDSNNILYYPNGAELMYYEYSKNSEAAKSTAKGIQIHLSYK